MTIRSKVLFLAAAVVVVTVTAAVTARSNGADRRDPGELMDSLVGYFEIAGYTDTGQQPATTESERDGCEDVISLFGGSTADGVRGRASTNVFSRTTDDESTTLIGHAHEYADEDAAEHALQDVRLGRAARCLQASVRGVDNLRNDYHGPLDVDGGAQLILSGEITGGPDDGAPLTIHLVALRDGRTIITGAGTSIGYGMHSAHNIGSLLLALVIDDVP